MKELLLEYSGQKNKATKKKLYKEYRKRFNKLVESNKGNLRKKKIKY